MRVRTEGSVLPKVVVVHRGARDAYQVATALSEAGLLERLVTDLYWPAESSIERLVKRFVPARLVRVLRQRSSAVPFRQTKSAGLTGLLSFALEKLPVPFSWRRAVTRWNDWALGRAAGHLATRRGSAVLSYSYYAHSTFENYRGEQARILFQAHPHPTSVRAILRRELELHPECAASLQKEWELALPEKDFERLVQETRMPQYWIAASSFTKRTLIENGIDRERIRVVPYGVDLQQFQPGDITNARKSKSLTLRLLFVGTINQRKGIEYLLEALRLLHTPHIELRVCGRVVDDLRQFLAFGSQIRITPAVSREELIQAYQTADLFVFPSVAEGFGQVLLEALACGLPILSTTRTAAPDLITEAREGFVVNASDPLAIAERLEWAALNRGRLADMRTEARACAETFTWERFRRGIVRAVRECSETTRHGEMSFATAARHVLNNHV